MFFPKGISATICSKNSKEFAKLVGVAQSTVSRALNNNPSISKEVRDHIQKEAKRVGFVLNNQARSLKLSRTNTIGILLKNEFISFSENLMVTSFLDSIQGELGEKGFDILIIPKEKETEESSPLIRIIKEHKVDGIISFRSLISKEEKNLLTDTNTPIVYFFSTEIEDKDSLAFELDFHDVGYKEGEFLSRHQGRVYYYMDQERKDHSPSKRVIGFSKGLAINGKELKDVIYCKRNTESTYNYVINNPEIFSKEKISIAVYNDLMALGVLMALEKLNIRVPEDVEIIGCDDIHIATWFPPYLSTARIPVGDMVKDGCNALIANINGKGNSTEGKKYLVDLVLRNTTL